MRELTCLCSFSSKSLAFSSELALFSLKACSGTSTSLPTCSLPVSVTVWWASWRKRQCTLTLCYLNNWMTANWKSGLICVHPRSLSTTTSWTRTRSCATCFCRWELTKRYTETSTTGSLSCPHMQTTTKRSWECSIMIRKYSESKQLSKRIDKRSQSWSNVICMYIIGSH